MVLSSYPKEYEVPKMPKADLRRDITAWGALVWAYRHENVRAASNAAEGALLDPVGFASLDLERVGGGGTVKGYLEAHEDAVAIDAKVQAWFHEVDRNWRDQLAVYAEAWPPRLPPQGSDLPSLRMLPMLRPNGAVMMAYDANKRAVSCYLTEEGYSEKEKAKVQDFYELFTALLDIMPGWTLTKWRIKGRGLTRCGESLTT